MGEAHGTLPRERAYAIWSIYLYTASMTSSSLDVENGEVVRLPPTRCEPWYIIAAKTICDSVNLRISRHPNGPNGLGPNGLRSEA